MYCINCGAEIKAEYNNCPYCGKALQMVPDYSIYDEDDINLILESTADTESSKTNQQEKTEAKTTSEKPVKKMETKTIIAITIILCVVLLGVGIGVKLFIDNKNGNSYEYQMKLGDEALFKEKIDLAEEYYFKALNLSPNDIKARIKLADVYIAKGEQNEAIKLLNEAISLDDTENYDVYKKLFDLYEADGNIDAILNLKKDVTNNKVLKIFQDYIVEAPSINMPGGSYEQELSLSIAVDKGLEVFYTLDGTNPITHGSLYTDAILISDAGMHTLKVVALNSLGIYSDIVTETYVLEHIAPADPTVTPNGGTFDTPTYVYITIPDGCSAYYTWDRSEPTDQSSEYVSPLLIPEGYNILSVIIIDDTTGLTSSIYRGVFEYITE